MILVSVSSVCRPSTSDARQQSAMMRCSSGGLHTRAKYHRAKQMSNIIAMENENKSQGNRAQEQKEMRPSMQNECNLQDEIAEE